MDWFTRNLALQVRAILDMHNVDLCSSIHRNICYIHSTQIEETRMELRYKSGDLVCWSVLRLRNHCPSRIICPSQVLLCTIRLSPTLLSLRIFPFHLYPCAGKLVYDSSFTSKMRHRMWKTRLFFHFFLWLCSVSPLCHWRSSDGWLRV